MSVAATRTKPTRTKTIRPPQQGDWTYEDYAQLPDNGMRYEVIAGELFMAPAPRAIHQEAALNLASELLFFLKEHKLGKVYIAPIDVVMGDLATPVQPDVVFIRQENLGIVKDKIEGVPDLLVEVLSPGSRVMDRRQKFDLYARVGVAEYWLVDPDECLVEVYVLRGRAYALLGQFVAEDTVQSELLPDLQIPVANICPP